MVEGFDWTEHDFVWNNLFPQSQTPGTASVISLISNFSNWKSTLFLIYKSLNVILEIILKLSVQIEGLLHEGAPDTF